MSTLGQSNPSTSQGKQELVLNLAETTNFFAHAITKRLIQETPYPFGEKADSHAVALRRSLAFLHEIDPTWILAGSGTAELIWFMLKQLHPAKILFIGPAHPEYLLACEALNIAHTTILLRPENAFLPEAEDFAKTWETDADLIILCSPNNPAGVTYENLHGLLQMIRTPRLLIDSTFVDFLEKTPAFTAHSYAGIQKFLRPGISLYTLHSFSQFYHCPGLGLAYIISDRLPLTKFQKHRPSALISPYALIMGELFLKNRKTYVETLQPLQNAVKNLAMGLRRCSFIEPDMVFEGPSFVTVQLPRGMFANSLEKTLQLQQILIKQCNAFINMPLECIRIQAKDNETTEKFLRALQYLPT